MGGLLFSMLFCPGKVTAQDRGLNCIKELMIPGYNLSSRRSASGGTITATVTLGKAGKISEIETAPSNPDLADEVRAYLRSSTYSDDCVGRQVEIKFTFLLEGEPEASPPVFVRFRPPNHFLIVSRPRRTMVIEPSKP